MSIELSSERRDLYAVAGELLDAHAPLSLARAFLEREGDSRPLWDRLSEVGWYATGLDADDPFGITGLCLLAEQCGAHAAPTPLVDTAVAARLAAAVQDPSGLVRELGAGEVTASLGLLEAHDDWSLDEPTTSLSRSSSGGFVLAGEKFGARHADRVDVLAVVAAEGERAAVAFVAPGAPGVLVERSSALDAAAAPCRTSFASVALASGDVGRPQPVAVAKALQVGTVATAAEGLGAARRALRMAIDYSRERYQFGRPIGSFQALQHIMSEAHVDLEVAWATVLAAAGDLDSGSASGEMVSIAKALGSRASRAAMETALQVHGGIAFTWEHDIHLLQRRVLDCERRFGDALHHERRLGDLLAQRIAGQAGSPSAVGEQSRVLTL